MPIVTTLHGPVHYEVLGRGKIPLVMHQGLGRSKDYWLGFEKELQKDFRVILIDTRGIGLSSTKLPWNLTIFDYADDVIAVMDALEIEKAHIFGLSLGGMVSLALTLKYPDRIYSSMVVNSSVAGHNSIRMTPKGILMMAKTYLKGENSTSDWKKLLVSKDMSQARRDQIVQIWQDIIERSGMPNAENCAKQIMAAMKFKVSDRLSQITVPTAIVYGDHDFFVPYYNSLKLHENIPGSSLICIPGAGHEAHLCQPELLRQTVVEFVKKHHDRDFSLTAKKAPGSGKKVSESAVGKKKAATKAKQDLHLN